MNPKISWRSDSPVRLLVFAALNRLRLQDDDDLWGADRGRAREVQRERSARHARYAHHELIWRHRRS